MRIVCLLFFIAYSFTALGQEDEKTRDLIENLAENISEDEDLSEFTERLAFFRKHPINLNKTTPEELKQLIFLSSLQIANFFHYLKAAKKLIDILELQAIPAFDPETINRLLPFVTIPASAGFADLQPKKLLNTGNNNLMIRYSTLFEQQKGFKDLPGSRYLGTPEKIWLRYRYNFSEMISAALVMEKDAGEPLFNKRTGMDHLSGHIALFKLRRIKKLVLGDYSLQFGQGLTLWSGFALGKGPDVTSVAARDVGLKPNTSANESLFFRGLTGTFELKKNLYLTPFISFRKLDASLKALPEGNFSLTNINNSGLHRTQTEVNNKNNLGQKVYGGALQYISDNLNVGLVVYQSSYQHQFVTGTQRYNKYSFTGKNVSNAGLHYNYTLANVYVYGELAHSIGTGWAMVNGAMANLSSKLSAVLLHRQYDKNYHNFFSSAVGEATESNNEKGWYAGLNYMLIRNLMWSVYADYFKFPWLKYRIDSASSGYEVFTQLAYHKGKTFKVVFRFKRELKQQNPDACSNSRQLEQVLKQSYRLEWNWKFDQKFNFQQRSELTSYQKGIKKTEIGYLIYQDINYAPLSSRIAANLRLAYFHTPSYNSRIYAYEDNVLYGASSGLYSGKGFRSYINIRFHLLRKMDIWTRYALSVYPGVASIGSGLDEIEGSKKAEIRIQLRYQF